MLTYLADMTEYVCVALPLQQAYCGYMEGVMARKLQTKAIDQVMPEMADLRTKVLRQIMLNPFDFNFDLLEADPCDVADHIMGELALVSEGSE